MRVTVTISGKDADGNPCVEVYKTELIEGSANTSEGFGVIRKFFSPDGGDVWVTFLNDGERPSECVYVEPVEDGGVHLTDLRVISMIAEDGSEAIRHLRER